MIRASISDIKNRLENLSMEEVMKALPEYSSDDRIGVRKLIQLYEKRLLFLENETERLYQMKAYERKYDQYKFIAGIDEVGRGPLCGPVVTAAVILPKDTNILYVNDSKKLSEQKREELYSEIMDKAIAVGIGMVHADVIDDINILNATYKAMKYAISNLEVRPDFILVDAVTIPGLDIPQVGIIKGDEKSQSIAAASIIAKVTRDRMMKSYSELYPNYFFAKNKGYGTNEHVLALIEHGPSPIHRRSFIKNIISAS
ncbi:MAG: ribonuclease HII [Firmicutes bacterium HGW-Firmicutes-7]|nr:MAG: ribonuclease HII [Firmicutes bacterium HGW-Firmicutes-7]